MLDGSNASSSALLASMYIVTTGLLVYVWNELKYKTEHIYWRRTHC